MRHVGREPRWPHSPSSDGRAAGSPEGTRNTRVTSLLFLAAVLLVCLLFVCFLVCLLFVCSFVLFCLFVCLFFCLFCFVLFCFALFCCVLFVCLFVCLSSRPRHLVPVILRILFLRSTCSASPRKKKTAHSVPLLLHMFVAYCCSFLKLFVAYCCCSLAFLGPGSGLPRPPEASPGLPGPPQASPRPGEGLPRPGDIS